MYMAWDFLTLFFSWINTTWPRFTYLRKLFRLHRGANFEFEYPPWKFNKISYCPREPQTGPVAAVWRKNKRLKISWHSLFKRAFVFLNALKISLDCPFNLTPLFPLCVAGWGGGGGPEERGLERRGGEGGGEGEQQHHGEEQEQQQQRGGPLPRPGVPPADALQSRYGGRVPVKKRRMTKGRITKRQITKCRKWQQVKKWQKVENDKRSLRTKLILWSWFHCCQCTVPLEIT